MPGVPAGAIIIDVRLKMPNMGEYAFLHRAPFILSKILLHHYLAKVVHHSKMRTFINAKCKYETRGSSFYTLTDLSFSESEISSSKWHSLVQILFKDISKTVMTQVM